jgi:hypothetical protein
VTPGATATSVTMTIATTASTSQALPRQALPRHSSNTYVAFATWMQLQGLGLFGIVYAGSKRRSKKTTVMVVLALLISALLFMTACAGGTGIAPQSQTGTKTGSYTVSATGTSGSLKHSTSLTLTVQ